MAKTDLMEWSQLVARTIAHNAQLQETQAWKDKALVILVSALTSIVRHADCHGYSTKHWKCCVQTPH